MIIGRETVSKVANLARFNLTEEEESRLMIDLERILAYINKLNELDTSNVEPTAHVMHMVNVFREDEVQESYDRKAILKNAPSQAHGCFGVPKVME